MHTYHISTRSGDSRASLPPVVATLRLSGTEILVRKRQVQRNRNLICQPPKANPGSQSCLFLSLPMKLLCLAAPCQLSRIRSTVEIFENKCLAFLSSSSLITVHAHRHESLYSTQHSSADQYCGCARPLSRPQQCQSYLRNQCVVRQHWRVSTNCVAEPQLLSCPSQNPLDVDTCCTETFGGLVLQTQFWSTYTGLESQGQLLPPNTWTLHGLWPDYCNG